MPALPADIVRATRKARVIKREDSAVQTAFPNARDMLDAPQPGFFVDAADATSALVLAADLVGAFRRRFIVSIGDEVEIDPETSVPAWTLVDDESEVNGPVLVTRIEIDDETETTSVEVLG